MRARDTMYQFIHIINVAIVVYNDSINMKTLMSPWGCSNNKPSNCPNHHA